MPIAVSSSSSHRGRRLSAGSNSNSGSGGPTSRSVSLGGIRGKNSNNKIATAASSVPPIIRTASPSSPSVKGILVHPSTAASTGSTTSDTNIESNPDNSPSSYLKPLLKFLPRHIDPATIARLLKNVHPTAFGSYRTKEAWRREHPEVLNTAQHINRQEQEEERQSSVDGPALRPSLSSDEFCLAHSPPSATFSSSEDDIDDEEELEFHLDGNHHHHDIYTPDNEEARELDEYFKDEDNDGDNGDLDNQGGDFDADLGTSPESASSLRNLHRTSSRRLSSTIQSSSRSRSTSPPLYHIPSSRQSSEGSSSTGTARGVSSQSTTISALADKDQHDDHSTILQSPLAIYLSKPDEELDSPLAGPISQRLHDFTSSSAYSPLRVDTFNDDEHHNNGPIASTSSAILYPEDRARTPPSPSSSLSPASSSSPAASPAPSPSLAFPSFSSSSRQHHSSSQPPPGTTTTTTSYSHTRSHHYPTISLPPRNVKRQRSSSSLASACTCRSNTSNLSTTSSTASRSSSVSFAPLPDNEDLKKRKETAAAAQARCSGNNDENGSSSDKSKVMGVKGRRNLLRGVTDDGRSVDDILKNRGSGLDPSPPQSNTKGETGESSQHKGLAVPPIDPHTVPPTSSLAYKRSILDDDNDEDAIYGSSDEDDDKSASSSANDARRSYGYYRQEQSTFDAIAYFGEEDLIIQNDPSTRIVRSISSSSNDTSTSYSSANSASPTTAVANTGTARVKQRKGSDVTIRYGKNGELVERRPLGVTLEELTLPMKRVKETRGRSRQTNDLSASFNLSKISNTGSIPSTPSSTSPPLIASPPLSPRKWQESSNPSSRSLSAGSQRNGRTQSFSSTFSTNGSSEKDSTTVLSSHEASEKTPTATPRFEKVDLFLTAISSPSEEQAQRAKQGSIPLSSSLSSTSNGTSYSSSNDITPIPTPRAGSPIASLKMTAAVEAYNTKKDFKLFDSATLRRPRSPSSSSSRDERGKDIVQVPSFAHILALSTLLDEKTETNTSPAASSLNVRPKPRNGNSPEPESGDPVTGTRVNDEPLTQNAAISDDVITSDDSESEYDCDEKTPTLHSSLALPTLDHGDEDEENEEEEEGTKNHHHHSNATSHARYRKKKTVGLPHITPRRRLSVKKTKK